MGTHSKQFKTKRRTARAIDKGKDLGDKTKDRVNTALDLVSQGNYGTTELANDLVGQSSDFVSTLTDIFGGSSDDEVPTLHLITNGPAPSGTVALKTEASGVQIDKGILFGPVTLSGGNTAATQLVAVNNMAANDYSILDPDSAAPLGADKVDSVSVQIVNVPATPGVYRGVLMLQNTDVLAEIVLVRR